MAISGENGSGKSTIIQAAASVYAPVPGSVTNAAGDLFPALMPQSDERAEGRFASDFFPDTPWDSVSAATIQYQIRLGGTSTIRSVRKPTTRWRGNQTRTQRPVIYIDLSRIQPVFARVGYARLAKPKWKEIDAVKFEQERRSRLSEIMGRVYSDARMASTDGDRNRAVPVVLYHGREISGYHQGAGELTMVEFLKIDPPKYSLVLIDEVETSLHPRAQRRLIRALADLAREREMQIILTTHSPYVLSELPPEARAYILETGDRKEVVLGVSPEFAMTKMDDEAYPECDIYVEDRRSEQFLTEILVKHAADTVSRVRVVPFGTASVGQALGIMVSNNRFPKRSLVFLDGDQEPSTGCLILPSEDAPERAVFEGLGQQNWGKLHERTGRNFSEIADACTRALTIGDHKEWIPETANKLLLSGDVLWQAMCAEWATLCLNEMDGKKIAEAVKALL